MTLLADLEEFVAGHRPHGTLTCDAPGASAKLLSDHAEATSS